jgi:hypothetical protein
LTAEPGVALAPAEGLWLITLPEGTVELLAVVTVPTTRPAPVIVLVATACVAPATFGTTSKGVPVTVQVRLAGLNATVRSCCSVKVFVLVTLAPAANVPSATDPCTIVVAAALLVTVATAFESPGAPLVTLIV